MIVTLIADTKYAMQAAVTIQSLIDNTPISELQKQNGGVFS